MAGELLRGEFVAIDNRRKSLRRPAKNCSGTKFGVVCKALWPEKTAENFAAVADCSVRTAHYRLSGGYEPTAEDLRIIINEMLR